MKLHDQQNALRQLNEKENFYYWPLDVLCVYLEKEKYFELRGRLQQISSVLNSFCEDYKNRCAHLSDLSITYEDLLCLVSADFDRDSKKMFPYIHELVRAHQNCGVLSVPGFSSISFIYDQAWIQYQHRREGIEHFIDLLTRFNREPSINQTFTQLIYDLRSFYEDYVEIGVLKFEVLYKRAIEMENVVDRYKLSKEEDIIEDKHEKFS